MKKTLLFIVYLLLQQNILAQTFSEKRILYRNQTYYDISSLDINEDGKEDIIYTTDLEIGFLKNTNNGDFDKPKQLIDIKNTFDLYAGDLDNDGLKDIIFSKRIESIKTVYFCKNLGSENFQDPIPIIIDSTTSTFDYKILDYDNDGDNEMIQRHHVPQLYTTETYTSFHKLIGNNLIEEQTILLFNSLTHKPPICLTDIDGDQDLDFVYFKNVDSTLNYIEFNSNTYSSTSNVIDSYPFNIRKIVAGDLNGNSLNDLLLFRSKTIHKNMNLGLGNFGQHQLAFNLNNFDEESYFHSFHSELRDINSDGKADFIANISSPYGSLLPDGTFYSINNGTGNFDNIHRNQGYDILSFHMEYTYMNINNDNYIDYAIVNEYNEIEIHLNFDGHYTNRVSIDTINSNLIDPIMFDVNNDGFFDIIGRDKTFDHHPHNLLISYGSNNYDFSDTELLFDSIISNYTIVENIDLNNDGFSDLILRNYGDYKWIKNNNGIFDGVFRNFDPVTGSIIISGKGDFSGNGNDNFYQIGYNDINIYTSSADTIIIESSIYDSTKIILSPNYFNNDNLMDYLTINKNDSSLSIHLNNGNYNFTDSTIIENFYNHYLYSKIKEVVDIDNNGLKDIVMPRSFGYQIYYQDAYLTFNRIDTILTNTLDGEIEFKDYDNDGDLDILVTNDSWAFSIDFKYVPFSWMENPGDGNFTELKSLNLTQKLSHTFLEDYTGNNHNDQFHIINHDTLAYVFCDLYQHHDVLGSSIYFKPLNSRFNLQKISVGNIDNDKYVDIFASGVHRLHNSGKIISMSNESYTIRNTASYTKTGVLEDYDSDGDDDIFFYHKSGAVYNYENGIQMFFDKNIGIDVCGNILYQGNPIGAGNASIKDINDDGINDIIVTKESNYIRYLEGLGNGQFGNCSSILTNPSNNFGDIFFHDYNHDGLEDILVIAKPGWDEHLSWIKNLGNGNYSNLIEIINDDYFNRKIISVDIDNDSNNEIICSGYGIGFSMYNTPIDSIIEYEVIDTTSLLMTTIDINSDNYVDIISINHDSIFVLINNQGVFNDKTFLFSTNEPISEINFYDNEADGDLEAFVRTYKSILFFDNNEINSEEIEVYVACGYYISPNNDTIYSNQTLIDTFENSFNGDSILTQYVFFTNYDSVGISETICQGESYLIGNNSYNSAGFYIDTLINQCGFDSIVTLSLAISPVSELNIIDTICFGESYFFNNDSIDSPGEYYDTLTNSSGCDSIITLNLNIININTNLTHQGGQINAELQNNASYQWINCSTNQPISGENSDHFTPTQNGNYAVEITLLNCNKTSECIDIYGIGINENDLNISVSPNPTNHYVDIEFTSYIPLANLTLTDALGKIISTETIKNVNTKRLNLENLSSGVYYLEINSSKFRTIKNIIKVD